MRRLTARFCLFHQAIVGMTELSGELLLFRVTGFSHLAFVMLARAAGQFLNGNEEIPECRHRHPARNGLAHLSVDLTSEQKSDCQDGGLFLSAGVVFYGACVIILHRQRAFLDP
jgi:hypothetical protein